MGKQKGKRLFVSRDPSAYWTFKCSKLLLIGLMLAYIAFVAVWTVVCMQYFKDKIVELNAANSKNFFKTVNEDIQLINSGRETQKLQTHRHFFLFTGLFVLGAAGIGLLGVLKELVSLILIFMTMTSISLGFEYVGAVKSGDEEVMQLKCIGIALHPIMLLLCAMYAFMIRRLEQRASRQPAYRQTIVGAVPEIQPASFVKSYKINNTGGGRVNAGLNLDDEQK